MDAAHIERTVKDLQKVAAGKGDASLIIGMLRKLQSGVSPTEDLLRSTKVGIVVNKLRQHENKDIGRLSTEMVTKWRSEVKAKGPSKPSPTSNGASSPAPSDKPKLTVPPEKRNHKNDGTDIKRTGDSVRDSCIGLVYDGLAFNNSTASASAILSKAESIEKECFNNHKSITSSDYKSKVRSLFQNLKNKSNPQLRANVMNGTISASRFATMTSDEMKSEERKKEDEKIKKENMNNAMVAKEEVSVSTSLQCGRCGQKKVSYTQAQTRSADEPMTTFCTCTVCGNRWKFS